MSLEKIKAGLNEELVKSIPTDRVNQEEVGRLLGGLNKPLFHPTGFVRFKRDRTETKTEDINI
ncbi:hypothetical protein AB1K84_25285 [Mesobacillus foraminis]|uniref:hypothetical protein n=1 Tax=Mesobacillus foraminis TaxID=279826 RepID=UPI0039A0670C